MPPKKGKKKKAKKIKMVGNETPDQVMTRVYKTYERNCFQTNTTPCIGIVRALKAAKEDQKLLTKFILEPPPTLNICEPLVALEPFIDAVRQERYTFITDLYMWQMPLNHTQIATLALMLEKGCYPVKHLEMMDCLVDPYSLRRLALSFNECASLSTLVFDHNEIGDAGAKGICEGLTGNKTVISLSMCYCGLEVPSGQVLGQVLANTALRELYIDGNDLECEGMIELLKVCVDHAEVEHTQALEEAQRKVEEEEMQALKEQEQRGLRATPTSDTSPIETGSKKGKKKKKKGKKKKSKDPPPPPPVGPWIYKLHLADNGVDCYSATGLQGKVAPLICMRLLRSLIAHSKCLEELDLEDNLIGDMGGRELVEGLEERKDAEMGGVKMRTTHRMNADTFNTLVKLGVGLKKKKKKGKKKKKK